MMYNTDFGYEVYVVYLRMGFNKTLGRKEEDFCFYWVTNEDPWNDQMAFAMSCRQELFNEALLRDYNLEALIKVEVFKNGDKVKEPFLTMTETANIWSIETPKIKGLWK